MFYESIGTLLESAGQVLTSRHGSDEVKDVRSEREFRQIALLLKRVGGFWPQLFASLQQELVVLDEALAQVGAQLAVAGLPLPPSGQPPTDPLLRYRRVLADLDVAVIVLHELPDEAWVSTAITRLRAGLAEAAEIQGKLVDQALAR